MTTSFITNKKSDRRQGAPSSQKFFLVRAVLVFLGLSLWLSACGAGTTFTGPSRLPREITPGTPLSAAVVNQFPSHVTGGGSLREFSVYTEGGYAQMINDKLQIGVAANYEYSDFFFTGMNFYVPRPWSDKQSFGGSVSFMYSLSDKYSLMLVPIIQAAGEHGADWNRALIYGGAGAVIISFGKDRTIGIGIGALNYLEQVSIFPFISLNWMINDQLRLSTPYRASPAGPGGVELTYWPIRDNKDLRIGLGGTYLSKRFRLSSNNPIANGIGEYDTIPIFARLSYRILPIVDVDLYGGASLYNYILVDDSKGGKLFHTHQNVAPFIGIGFSLNFQKIIRGGG